MKKNNLLFFIILLFPRLLFSFPIDLIENWKYAISNEETLQPSQWKELQKLPLNEDSIEWNFSQKIIYLIFQKEIEIQPDDIQSIGRDLPSLHIPFVGSYYKIYWNGNLLKKCGVIEGEELKEVCIRRHLVLPLSKEDLKIGKNTLSVITASTKGLNNGLWAVINDINFNLDLLSRNLFAISERVTIMLAFLYFFMGIYHLLFFIKRPQESYNLYYSLFSIFLATYIYTRSNVIFEHFGEGIWLKRAEFSIVFLIPSFLLFFLERFFLNKISLLSKLYFAYVFTLAIIGLFIEPGYLNTLLLMWQLSTFYVLGHSIVICVLAIKRKHPDIGRLLIGFLTLIIAAIWDILGAMGVLGLENLGLARFGFFVFVSGIAFILAERFLRVHKEVETLNQELEKKVEERTLELKESLEEVKKLKIQQDGDYFLTSLLINPLSRNMVPKPIHYFKVEVFAKQKKEFEFRGKKIEIGGDINIVNRITLRGREYIVFVNGDAMGKSIQGAGGALVLGVIFHSVVNRTHTNREVASKLPEIWLRDCYSELQGVFEAFDGSMLISVVIGIIDVQSGFMYYINAEHPWCVLYRDGKASFIEHELELRKIGTIGIGMFFRVKTAQLEAGDVIFVGSDGRDDLIIGIHSNGERIINEDENLFLASVEESQGQLEKLVETIRKKGELSDDLSLIRIEYETSNEHLHETYNQSQEIIESLLKEGELSFKDKDFKKASSIYSKLVEDYPQITNAYFYASYSYKKLKNLNLSILYGESMYLRDPNHVRNLLNLADLYLVTGQIEKASGLLNRIEDLAPKNPKARRAIDRMNQAIQQRLQAQDKV